MKRKLFATVGLLLLVAALLLGCGAKSARDESVMERQVESRGYSAPAEAPAPAAESKGDGAVANSALEGVADQMIIRTVNMTMMVDDTDRTLAELRGIVANAKGYVSDSNRYLVGEQPWASITLRVPAGALDGVLDQVRGLAIRVENESSNAQDVTEEYTDLQARLRNLEATEKELQALLTEVRENRGKADEILAVHTRMMEVRGQIEQIKGRAQYLQRMVAMATLHLEIRPKEAPISVVQPSKWSPMVTLSKALRAFVEVLQVFADLLVYVVIFSPFVLVPLAVIWLLIRAVRKRRAKK